MVHGVNRPLGLEEINNIYHVLTYKHVERDEAAMSWIGPCFVHVTHKELWVDQTTHGNMW